MSSASFIDLVQAVAFFFSFKVSVAGRQSCFHLKDGPTFVFIYAPLRLKGDRKREFVPS